MASEYMTKEKLKNLPVEMLAEMYLQLLDSFEVLKSQNELLIKRTETLQEKIDILTQQRFGRKTEKVSAITEGQLTLHFLDDCINEAEALVEEGIPEEPAEETVIVRRKPKGKRDADLKDAETVIDEHLISEDRLNELFPSGYHRLPDEIYRDVELIPASVLVHEHHIAVYAGNKDEGIVKADRPERLLKNSILTPSLGAGIFNAKYVNATPINRLSQEFSRYGINVSRQVMAGWMITITERYLNGVYRRMQEEILKSKLIHCDETPFKLIDNGRSSGSKDYMWVYHTSQSYGSVPIYLYEYSPTRNADTLRSFLGDYKGILVTDGYQVYHTVANESDTLKVAGCWAHAKRKFAEIVKSIDSKAASSLTASEGVARISAIYHVDNMYKDRPPDERLKNRKQSVSKLVDAYFTWVNDLYSKPMDKGSKLYEALRYSHNQEKYLRLFLTDAMIPMDNNDAERSIKAFCVGKHSWHVIDSKRGAKASGILYSIAETAKANELKPYYYFKYLLEEILKHLDDSPKDYLDDLMPWSENIPSECRKKTDKK